MFSGSIELDIDVLSFIVIISLSFIGSLAKDYILLFKYNQKIKFARIFLSTITSSIFSYCLEPVAIENFGFRGLIMISFLSGLVGFEILTRISSVKGVVELIGLIFFSRSTDFRDYKDVIRDGEDKPPPKEKIIVVYKDKTEKSDEDDIEKIIKKDGK